MLRKALDAICAAVPEAAAAARRRRRWPRARFRPDAPSQLLPLGARQKAIPALRGSSRHGSGGFIAGLRPNPRGPGRVRAAAACRELDRAPIACDVARRALSVRLPGQRHYSAAALGRLVAPYVGLADHAASCAAGNGGDPSTPSRRPHYRFSYPVPHRRWPRCRFRRLSLHLRRTAGDSSLRACDVLRRPPCSDRRLSRANVSHLDELSPASIETTSRQPRARTRFPAARTTNENRQACRPSCSTSAPSGKSVIARSLERRTTKEQSTRSIPWGQTSHSGWLGFSPKGDLVPVF